jgi:choline kinase
MREASMQAIILAAGYGKRLRPLTDRIPKCLVPVKGKPLLVRSLELLDARNIHNVLLVVGHMKEKVYSAIGHQFGRIRISYVENDIYDKTNNVYSLWLARDRLLDDVLLLECDLCYEGSVLDALLARRTDCNVLVSRYDPSSMDGTVVSIGADGTIQELILKKHQHNGFIYRDKYKTVNMYYFGRDFLREYLLPYLDLYVRVHGSQSYYELVLGVLVYLGEPKCQAVIVDSDKWCEIDNAEDLCRAEDRFCGG